MVFVKLRRKTNCSNQIGWNSSLRGSLFAQASQGTRYMKLSTSARCLRKSRRLGHQHLLHTSDTQCIQPVPGLASIRGTRCFEPEPRAMRGSRNNRQTIDIASIGSRLEYHANSSQSTNTTLTLFWICRPNPRTFHPKWSRGMVTVEPARDNHVPTLAPWGVILSACQRSWL